jgi:hypothetical protein
MNHILSIRFTDGKLEQFPCVSIDQARGILRMCNRPWRAWSFERAN